MAESSNSRWLLIDIDTERSRQTAYVYAPESGINLYAEDAPYVPLQLVMALAYAVCHPPNPLLSAPQGDSNIRSVSGQTPKPSGWTVLYAERWHLVTEGEYKRAMAGLSQGHRQDIAQWLDRVTSRTYVKVGGKLVSLRKISREQLTEATGWVSRLEGPPLVVYGGLSDYGVAFSWLAAALFPQYVGSAIADP